MHVLQHALLQEKTEQDEAKIEVLTQQVQNLQNHIARLEAGGAVQMTAAHNDLSPAGPQATPMLDSRVSEALRPALARHCRLL